jgi:hypothetical protein
MGISNNEVPIVKHQEKCNSEELFQLRELELACVGGGIGDVVGF